MQMLMPVERKSPNGGVDALKAFDTAVANLDRTLPPRDPTLADQAKQLAKGMETLGTTNVGVLQPTGEARAVTQSLLDGSL